MDLARTIGFGASAPLYPDDNLVNYLNLKLATLGCPIVATTARDDFQELAASLLHHHRETDRLLAGYLCPADQRIQAFLDDYLAGATLQPKLPEQTFVLDRHGLARALSLPPSRDVYQSELLSSYRIRQGVLHNPRSDRRTTQGIFHVVDGGLPVPNDKKCVPVDVFARLLDRAFRPPPESLRLPFTSAQAEQAECFVSLLLRPTVSPEVAGVSPRKSMEIRFFVPGMLVSNLDFVESIFGNGGDPYLPEHDAGLDVEHWTGHSGCVILAPHLVRVTKKSLGLPPWREATERQRRDGMCWKKPGELYNDGAAFKLTCRDERGVIVTLIADNYFGYCKKEVKTQISYSANLYGSCEEEHAGGALVYASYDLGEEFSGDRHVRSRGHKFQDVLKAYGQAMAVQPEGHAIDRKYPDIIYVPENVHFDLHEQIVEWTTPAGRQSIRLLPGRTYVRPSGYKVHMEKPPGGRVWRLVGTSAEGLLCHKPCTVSGGGKSEISKPITDAILTGPVFVANFQGDFDQVEALLRHDYSRRFKDPKKRNDRRPVLSPNRSLGSVIKLLTPSARDYTDDYNAWLGKIPQYLKELVFVVKRVYHPEWDDRWRRHFSVDIINGTPGNELKFDNRRLITTYLRVGFDPDGSWRTFGMRKDFQPAIKLSMEDDITASVVVPARRLRNLPADRVLARVGPSVKFVANCEFRLFQRPDDAIHRGYDRQTEADFTAPGNFLSNYEPLDATSAQALLEDSIGFDKFTEPMRELIATAAREPRPQFFACTASPRLVDGKPSKNPRYLQTRPDLLDPRQVYLNEMSTRMHRRVPLGQAVHNPVAALLPGRRNNPADAAAGIRPLCAYSPIHYMELPELFMEFIASMTGKSPSTTGAGSEGALTKGPFNALPPIIDLNNAFVSQLLTGHHAFLTSAGYVGPRMRVDHDVSLLVPEIWCRMAAEERDPAFLIREGYLERCDDFEHRGEVVPASRLGYRITRRFVRSFFGRMFNHPHVVFPDEMLRPELQDADTFADAMENIVGTQRRVAEHYFADGSIEAACPPLQVLLHIMRDNQWKGRTLDDPGVRQMFTLEHLLKSTWYADRLRTKQQVDIALWQRHTRYLRAFLAKSNYADEAQRLQIGRRLAQAEKALTQARRESYRRSLVGTLGTDPAVTRARRRASTRRKRGAAPAFKVKR